MVGVFPVTYIFYMLPKPCLLLSGSPNGQARDLCYDNKQHRSADCSVSRPTVGLLQYNRQPCTQSDTYHSPPPCECVERVDKLTILGVVVNSCLATDHVDGLMLICSSLVYSRPT